MKKLSSGKQLFSIPFFYLTILGQLRLINNMGNLGGSVGWAADCSSGHDFTVHEFKPPVGLIGLVGVSTEPALDPLAPSLSASLSLSLKNKH